MTDFEMDDFTKDDYNDDNDEMSPLISAEPYHIDDAGETALGAAFGTDERDPFLTPAAPRTTSMHSAELKRQKIQQLAQHLNLEKVGLQLIDLSRLKLEKADNGLIMMKYLKNNGDWAYVTNRRTGQFLADSTLYTIFSGTSGLKQF